VPHLKNILVKLAIGSCVLIGFFLGWLLFIGLSSAELEEPTTITIERGATLGTAATELANKSIIDNARSFKLLAWVFGISSDIKAGKYKFEDGVTGFQVLQKIYRGYFEKNRLRIQEGWTFADLRKALDDHDAILHSSTGWTQKKILNHLNIPYEHVEGLFFPDTYIFSGGTSDLEILKIAHEKLSKVLEEEWRKRNIKIRFKDPYNALILASIIEKETSLPAEKSIVSGVFMNRLKNGMRLQADPTVIYGLGDNFDGDIRYKDLKADNPYNTYTRNGLPPSPIALPSRSSIRAVMHPASTTALYFVAKGDGTHQFSDNLSDHNTAVKEYQR